MSRPAFRLFLAQSFDGLTFLVFMLAYPAFAHAEQNPLVAGAYAAGGVGVVLAVKVAIGLLGAYLATHVSISRPRLVIALMAAATASGIVGAGSNVAALIGASL